MTSTETQPAPCPPLSPLRRIEAELTALAVHADEKHPIDPFAIKVIARKVAAQAEMEEGNLS